MHKIAVVDDESSVRKMIKSMLDSPKYEILEAKDGREAKALCESQAIDLMITDIVMPGKHGIDLIMEVRKEHPDTRIIAISGGGGVTGRFDYLAIAKLVGAENILEKPFAVDYLRELVTAELGE